MSATSNDWRAWLLGMALRVAGMTLALSCLILLTASEAKADPVTFSTSGTFTCGGCSGSGTNSVTFLGGMGNALMITFTGLGSTSLNTPTDSSFGNFQTFVSGNGPITASGTFNLRITQTVPSAGSGSFGATFAGTFSASNSGSGVVNFTVTMVTIGGVEYDISNNPLNLVPPASNNGITTVQGLIGPPTSTPTATPTATRTATQTATLTPTSTLAVTATATPTCILADINCDGIVDIRDYGIWRQQFGATNCGNPADLNRDCMVDIRDYGIWRANFGQTAGAAARTATPLPAPRGATMPAGMVPLQAEGATPPVPLVPLVGGLIGLGGLAGWRARRPPRR